MPARSGALPDTPLRPDELETYKTDVATEAEALDTGAPTPGADARPWLGLGIGLLVVFLVALALGIALVLPR
jgi:hypothetical protein